MPRARRGAEDLEVPSFLPVPRPGGGDRLLARLPERDARAYEGLVGSALPAIERALGPEVSANRALPGPGVRLEPVATAHARHRAALGTLLTAPDVRAVLVLDVADFYPSTAPATVERAIRWVGAPALAEPLGRLLRSLGERGVRGLPVGPEPSAVLANAVLGPLDAALRGAGLRHLRWVDDVVAPAPDAGAARRGLERALRALDALGLVPNPRKTRILTEPEEVRAAAGWGAPSGLAR
jgi:hypothetical protein